MEAECYNKLRYYAAVITLCPGLFVLAFSMNLLFSNEQFERMIGLC